MDVDTANLRYTGSFSLVVMVDFLGNYCKTMIANVIVVSETVPIKEEGSDVTRALSLSAIRHSITF